MEGILASIPAVRLPSNCIAAWSADELTPELAYSCVCLQVSPLWLSAACATVALLPVYAAAHHAKHRHQKKEIGESERYRRLVESIPPELWDIAVRIKTQRGVCVGAPEAEVRHRQTLVRGRMKARGYSNADIQKYCQSVTALTLE